MEILKRGTGKVRPALNDCVKLQFSAWSSDGRLYARSGADGAAELTCIRRLVPGVAQAVRAMVAGEQRRVRIPARLTVAAGEGGRVPSGPGDLVYELTLLQVIVAPPTPKPLKAAPARARLLPSGLAILVLKQGSGSAHPTLTDRVTLHVSGWTEFGALFESTLMADQPSDYEVRSLLPGLREGVQLMVVGERARFWLPSALAFGNERRRPGQPAGSMVYEVELRAIQNTRRP